MFESRYPHVSEAHNCIPYLHNTKHAVAAAKEVAEDEELVVFLKQDEILASQACRKVILELCSKVHAYIYVCFCLLPKRPLQLTLWL